MARPKAKQHADREKDAELRALRKRVAEAEGRAARFDARGGEVWSEMEIQRRRAEAAEARCAKLEEALRNTLAVLLTFDVSDQHGVVVRARAALGPAARNPVSARRFLESGTCGLRLRVFASVEPLP